MSVTEIADKSWVRRDDFKKMTALAGTKIYYGKNTELNWQQFNLAAQIFDNGQTFYFVHFDTMREAWKGRASWTEAYDRKGAKFTLTSDASNRSFRSELESDSVEVSREYLESIRPTGIEWRLYGTEAEHEVPIEAKVVEGFLLSVDRHPIGTRLSNP